MAVHPYLIVAWFCGGGSSLELAQRAHGHGSVLIYREQTLLAVKLYAKLPAPESGSRHQFLPIVSMRLEFGRRVLDPRLRIDLLMLDATLEG